MVVVKVDPSSPPGELFSEGVLDQIVAGFTKNGWLSMNSVIEADVISLAKCAIDEYLENAEERNDKKLNLKVGDKRFMESLNICPPFDNEKLFCPPKVLQVLVGLLGNDLVLNSYTAVISFPGSKDQGIHADGGFLFDDPVNPALPPHAITVAIPLINISEECGSTAIWNGSHIQGDSAVRGLDGILLPAQIPFPKLGDVYMFDYRIKHAGMANNSVAARPILFIVFSKPWWIDPTNFSSQRKPVQISKDNLDRIPSHIKSLFRLVFPD